MIDISCPDPQAGSGSDKAALIAAPLAAVAAIGVDFAIEWIGGLLKDAQAKRNAVWSASGVAEHCARSVANVPMTLRRAVVTATNPDGLASPGFELKGSLTFEKTTVGWGDKAKEVLTAQFRDASLTYGRSAARTRGSGRKHVVVLLALSENPVLKGGEATGEEAFPHMLRIDLGTLADGRTYGRDMLGHVRASTAIPMPSQGHLVATAIVVESEDELLALKALTAAFDANKGKLRDAIVGGE